MEPLLCVFFCFLGTLYPIYLSAKGARSAGPGETAPEGFLAPSHLVPLLALVIMGLNFVHLWLAMKLAGLALAFVLSVSFFVVIWLLWVAVASDRIFTNILITGLLAMLFTKTSNLGAAILGRSYVHVFAISDMIVLTWLTISVVAVFRWIVKPKTSPATPVRPRRTLALMATTALLLTVAGFCFSWIFPWPEGFLIRVLTLMAKLLT